MRKGSVPLTYGSGSDRPQKMRLLRIRIPNTACNYSLVSPEVGSVVL
jgi:hypothetical protein